jgi:hypothetical protein
MMPIHGLDIDGAVPGGAWLCPPGPVALAPRPLRGCAHYTRFDGTVAVGSSRRRPAVQRSIPR